MSDAPVVSLDLPAKAEGVGVVRQALVGVADGLALDSAILSDAKMAVTEACTNCVVHAFPDGDGRFQVDMLADDLALTVVVRDRGNGMRPPEEGRAGTAALGLGLPLIMALSDGFELDGEPGRGTQVSMRFDYERSADPADENPITGGLGSSGYWESEEPA
jgi:serine/threonine-protein kinase RsbW